MLPLSLRFRIPASVYRKKICLLFLSGSIGPTRHGPENPERGLASRLRGGLRKHIARRFLSKVLLARVRLFKFAFRYTRRFVAACSAMNRKLPMSTIQKTRDLYKTRKYKQAYLASIYGVSSAQISRIVNLKRRQFVGNEEIAFPHEQKRNAHEEIAFPHEQKRNAYEEIAFPHEQKQNAHEEIAFPHEQKQNAHEEIAFADEQKRNAREEIAFPDCGRGAKEVLLPPSLECTSGIRFNRPNWQDCCIRHR